MKLIISTILFILMTSMTPVHGEDLEQKVFMIKVRTSLDTLADKLLPRFKTHYGKRVEELKKDLMEWNPQITNWQEIPLFSKIYIEYPYPIYVSHKYAPRLEQDKEYSVINADAETPEGDNRFTLFSMLTTSAGNFQEQLAGQEGSIKSKQNSPFTIGLGSTIFLDKTNRMLSTSFYWSNLRPSTLNGTTVASNQSELTIKPEYGFNLYYQQMLPTVDMSLYGGVDYEQFSTFNTSEYVNGADLALNSNKIYYGTLGAGKTFFINDNRLLIKGNFSQSLSSTSSSVVQSSTFKGQRMLLFASYKGDSRFTYHVIFKRHMFEGPTKLTINRVGVGIGFIIF